MSDLTPRTCNHRWRVFTKCKTGCCKSYTCLLCDTLRWWHQLTDNDDPESVRVTS